jgi:hypothetical protein
MSREADNLAAIYEPTVWTMWDPPHLTTLQASTAYYGDDMNETILFVQLYAKQCRYPKSRGFMAFVYRPEF